MALIDHAWIAEEAVRAGIAASELVRRIISAERTRQLSVSDLAISVRSENLLHVAGVRTVRQLRAMSPADLRRLGLSQKACREIAEALSERAA